MSEYITDAEIDEMVRRLEAHVAVDIRTALRDAVLWGARYAEVRQQSKSGTSDADRLRWLAELLDDACDSDEKCERWNAWWRGLSDRADARTLEAIREQIDAANPPPKPNSPEHVCGASGYNGMIDPPCPGCQRSSQECSK